MFRIHAPIKSILLVAAVISATHSVNAAPGFEYELIYIDGQFTGEILRSGSNANVAINEAGDVAFVTRDFSGVYRAYFVGRGQAPVLIFEPDPTVETNPVMDGNEAIGLSDGGLVSVPSYWPLFDGGGNPIGNEYGYQIFDPGSGLVREIRDLRWSSGRVGDLMEMAGRNYSPNDRLLVSDGLTSEFTLLSFTPGSNAQINRLGIAAVSGRSAGNETVISWGQPPAALQTTVIGDSNGLGYSTNAITPGMNGRGELSYVTNNDGTDSNPNPRVLMIDRLGGVHSVAETLGSEFVNFWQPRSVRNRGVPINDSRRVAFAGENSLGQQGLWMGDVSGDAPTLIVGSADDDIITFTDGSSFRGIGFSNDVTNFGSNSLNNAGEIVVAAVGTFFPAGGGTQQSSTTLVFVARPSTVGLEPANPVIPDPGNILAGGGFRFAWNQPQVRQGALGVLGSPRIFYDPPLAVGYDYVIDNAFVGAFTSALIPVALPGGDESFTIEFNGVRVPLEAGSALTFSGHSPDPVRRFRILGIDKTEVFDPNDPLAFVTGLTFADTSEQNLTFVMTPVFDISSGLVAVNDSNTNGAAEVAMLHKVGASALVGVRDGATDGLLADIDFGTDPVIAVEVIDDINGNGAQEIALLGSRATGQNIVQVRDSLTGTVVNNIFYGTEFSAIDLAVIPDTNGNAAAELAVMGRNASGGVRVQVRDALDDTETSTSFYGSNATPIDLQVLPDINSNGYPEVVVHARVDTSGQSRAQIRDTQTGALIRQMFFGTAYDPLQLAVVDDVSGDGLPDLAQLGLRADTGAARVQIRASSGGPVVSNAYLGDADLPVAIVGIGDANGDTVPDTAVLVERPDGTAKVVVRDGATGDFIRNIFMGAITGPTALIKVSDLDASGDPELAALGESAGMPRVQIRDSISGAQINNIDYP